MSWKNHWNSIHFILLGRWIEPSEKRKKIIKSICFLSFKSNKKVFSKKKKIQQKGEKINKDIYQKKKNQLIIEPDLLSYILL